MLGHQRRGGVQGGVAHGAAVRLDRLVPQPRHHPKRDATSSDRGPTAGTSRWVKVSGIIALAVVMLLIILLLTGGNHGPGRMYRPVASVAPWDP